jgi:hypothetical protein
MASISYMNGRKKYQRPQAMLWANNPGYTSGGLYLPNGFEVGQTSTESEDQDLLNEFMVLSDDNRSPLQFETQRIEKRERMINGRMRSYHVADKLTLSTSWDMLPSRSFKTKPNFNASAIPDFNNDGTPEATFSKTRVDPGYEYGKRMPQTLKNPNDSSFVELDSTPTIFEIENSTSLSNQFTSDGGAGGVELLEWYNTHQDSFWVYLSYDKYTNFSEEDENRYDRLGQYNEIIEMFIANFSYSVEKRGGLSHDLWNISVTLEEV